MPVREKSKIVKTKNLIIHKTLFLQLLEFQEACKVRANEFQLTRETADGHAKWRLNLHFITCVQNSFILKLDMLT